MIWDRQKLTRAGFGFSAASVVVGVAAFVSANNLLFLLLAAMLATLLVSGFVGRLSLASLALDFEIPEHVSARQPMRARVRVHNEKRWMASYSIQVRGTGESVFSAPIHFPVIPGRTLLEQTVDVVFARRGRHRENSFQFTTRFPFGFAERRIQVKLPREVLVYPSLEARPGFETLLVTLTGEMEAQQRGRGHDFYRIRPYEPLESARHVDWKATAHIGQLQVREFAREQDPLVEIFLDIEASDDHDWFEQAVECCAFLAWRVSRMEARLRFRTQEFDLCLPAEGDVYTILKYLALVSARKGRVPIAPPDEDSYPIVFSPMPGRFLDQGWANARMVGWDGTGFVGADAAAGAGEDVDHGCRKGER